MSRVLGAVADPPRFVMMLMTAFAVLALTLAALGIYGMLSYAVSHRRREFGIRLALGARPSGVVGLILREGLTLVIAGCVIGDCWHARGRPLALRLPVRGEALGPDDGRWRSGGGARRRDTRVSHSGTSGIRGRPCRSVARGLTLQE